MCQHPPPPTTQCHLGYLIAGLAECLLSVVLQSVIDKRKTAYKKNVKTVHDRNTTTDITPETGVTDGVDDDAKWVSLRR